MSIYNGLISLYHNARIILTEQFCGWLPLGFVLRESRMIWAKGDPDAPPILPPVRE
jgi:hypothetical protein